MISRVPLLAVAALAAIGIAPALAQETVKVGELNSYKSQPAFLEPYWTARRELPQAMDTLARLVADNTSQTRQLARIQAQLDGTLQSLEALRQSAGAGLEALEQNRAQMAELNQDLTFMEDDQCAHSARLIPQLALGHAPKATAVCNR